MLSVQLTKQRGDFRLELAFAAPASGLIALFGRSGCGKSTALNLIAGLLPADSGRIELEGHTLYDAARGIDVPAERPKRAMRPLVGASNASSSLKSPRCLVSCTLSI